MRLALFAFFSLILAACSDAPSVAVVDDPCSPWPCDTCGNYYPTPAGPYMMKIHDEPAGLRTRHGRLSPDGRWLAFVGTDFTVPEQGMSVMHVDSRDIVYFARSTYAGGFAWSIDSKTLYFIDRQGSLCTLDMRSGEVSRYLELGKFSRVRVAPSGNYLYLTGSTPRSITGVVRWDMRSDTAEFLGRRSELHQIFMVLNDSVLCAIIPGKNTMRGLQGLYFMNVNTGALRRVHLPEFGDRFASENVRGELSPDRSRILFEPGAGPGGNVGYLNFGVWMLNIHTLELRQVLPRHQHFAMYNQFPSWSGNSTFIADWLCVKDSAITLHEYDLGGNTLRQFTHWHTKFWVTR